MRYFFLITVLALSTQAHAERWFAGTTTFFFQDRLSFAWSNLPDHLPPRPSTNLGNGESEGFSSGGSGPAVSSLSPGYGSGIPFRGFSIR